jgi:hypothetical protein
VTDDLSLIVKAFHRAIADGHIEITENIFFFAAQHPSKISHWFQPGMCRPPEPLVEELFG